MTKFPQKFSKLFLGAAIRVVTLALLVVVFGTSAALAQTRAYVTRRTASTVAVISTATNTLVATVSVARQPIGVAITPNGAFAYVANLDGNTVSVISTATNTVVATVPVGISPQFIAFGTQDPIGSLIAQVQALIAGGTLTQNQGDALINKLGKVAAKLDNGQTNAACGQLGAFVNQVNAFINNGSLTPGQGQALIDAANAIRANLGC
jgi:YVTN family beta-propeller protein